MQFEWDDEKAAANETRHGVSFEEAETVFLDPLTRVDDDPDHSAGERRLLIFGRSAGRKACLDKLCGTWRHNPDHQRAPAEPTRANPI